MHIFLLTISENLATHLNESWTHHFQLGLTKIFRNVFWTHQIKLLQVFLSSFIVQNNNIVWTQAKFNFDNHLHRYLHLLLTLVIRRPSVFISLILSTISLSLCIITVIKFVINCGFFCCINVLASVQVFIVCLLLLAIRKFRFKGTEIQFTSLTLPHIYACTKLHI